MKKFVYTLLIAFAVIFTVTSCTEEEIKPQSELANGGGSGYTGDLN